MKDRYENNEGDWAQNVPERRFQSPYEDYGWERGQSVLPQFRDPGFHFSPDERERLGSWQRFPVGEEFRGQNIPGSKRGMGPRNYVRSDTRIYEEVCERMTRHGQLDASDIEVDVKNGEVTLTGEVSNRKAKRLAEDISYSSHGVQDVQNRLQVREKNFTPERWIDQVGGSGVYPASAMHRAPQDSQTQGMASWGQGERGAEGYNDHGDSEIHPFRKSNG
jgi:hypothetical protein